MFRPFARPLLAFVILALVAGCRPHGIEALRRGDEALRAGQVAKAIPLLEQAVTDLPSDARSWNYLGLAYRAAGRDQEAMKAYLRALERNRGFLDAWFNVGLLHFEQGNWLESERALRTYLGTESCRTNAVAWRTLGLAQFESNQLDLAERSLATATQLDPRDAEAWNGVGLTQVARRRYRDAQKTFAYVTGIAPDFAPGRLNAAVVVHQHLGDRRAAIPLYRAYLALRPANAAEVEALIGQLEESLRPPPGRGAPPAIGASDAPTRAATNRVSAVPTPPAGAITNPAPTVARIVPTNRPAAVTPRPAPPTVASNPPTRTSAQSDVPTVVRTPETRPEAKPARAEIPPEPKPEPEPEVVRLEPEPPLLVARDVPAPETTAPSQPTATEPVTGPAAKPDGADVARADVAGEEGEPGGEPSRGFWQRANPGNWNWRKANPASWFGGTDSGSTNRATPLPATAAGPGGGRQALALPRIATNPVRVATAPKPKPAVARRQRQVPASIPAGNRAAAEQKFNEALLVHNRRDYASAAALYEQATVADPTFYPAQHNLALLSMDLNNPARAVTAAEYAVTLQPEATASRQLYAAALQRANFPADAAEELERLVAARPNDAQTHFTLAGLYASNLGNPAQARAHYLRVLELEPNHPQASAIRIWLAGNP